MNSINQTTISKSQWLDLSDRSQLKLFYRQYMPYAKPNKKEAILTISIQDIIVASARLRPIGEYTLLTGMLVHPEYRGQGLAHQLMQLLSDSKNLESTYIFAIPELTHFYQSYHFIPCETAPNDITQLFNKYRSDDKPLILMAYKPQPNI